MLIKDGIASRDFDSWKVFMQFLQEDLLNLPGYIYRGQKDSAWLLQSTFDRTNKKEGCSLARHLLYFKGATRGRRGAYPKRLDKDNEWWALGRHYGLATPLIDWTTSPFVALFFAFSEYDEVPEYRSIFAFLGSICFDREDPYCDKLRSKLDIFNVDTSENNRMLGQSGIFMKLPEGKDLESIVKKLFVNENRSVLVKMNIRNKGREDCLRLLSRMNINYSTIFPDLNGAADFCNMALSIESYIAGGYVDLI